MHSYRDGRAKAPATASDYANMIWAALRLNEATNDRRYFEQAVAWTDTLDKHYWMERDGDVVMIRLRAPPSPTSDPVPLD